jgi:hypothetical protein
MKDIIAVIKSIFVGAGQQVPTLTKQYAGKVNVKPGGLIIEGAAGDVSWRLQAERLVLEGVGGHASPIRHQNTFAKLHPHRPVLGRRDPDRLQLTRSYNPDLLTSATFEHLAPGRLMIQVPGRLAVECRNTRPRR